VTADYPHPGVFPSMSAVANSQAVRNTRAWYESSIQDFLASDDLSILGSLANRSEFDLESTQKDAWNAEFPVLRSNLTGLTGRIYIEYPIPRMGRRIDVVILIGSVAFVIEFKVGSGSFDHAAIDQVWDYALDLKNFHEACHALFIVPILIATEAANAPVQELILDGDSVYRPILGTPSSLRKIIDLSQFKTSGPRIDELAWGNAPYHPTPTIVEAARSLYAQHSVEAIARSDAGAKNLAITSLRIEDLADTARLNGQKIICFVTGVPGAGKTLVGLNVATKRSDEKSITHAVFLSGNGPLVDVLREALTRDDYSRRKLRRGDVRKGKIYESVKAFIQNVHHFRDSALEDENPPIEHIVIFDEAQRAWNKEQTASFMKRKKGRPNFGKSEPEFLISCMDRHRDWAVIVCLVGGGQEINTGEAGIDAWLDAINTDFSHWHAYASSQLTDSEYSAGHALVKLRARPNAHFDDNLHLAVSMRSFRAENVSDFIKALLDCEEAAAKNAFSRLAARYPIVLTRDLEKAKHWIRSRARGSERFGLVASSKAQRLKPHAIDIRVKIDPVHWFLDGRDDTRSSYYLEDAATEFQVQGLELDWTCVTWDGDLRHTGHGWSFHDFRGDGWTNIGKPERQTYLLNAYRVLLTRARQGMVLFVPWGETKDSTRSSSFYDPTFDYLGGLGIPVLS
jgi:Uncharacterized conserved protein (DUF2075)